MKASIKFFDYIQSAVNNFNYWADNSKVIIDNSKGYKMLQGILYNKLKNTGIGKNITDKLKPSDFNITIKGDGKNHICKLEINDPENGCFIDRAVALRNLKEASLNLSYVIPENYKPICGLPEVIKNKENDIVLPPKKDVSNIYVSKNLVSETIGQKTEREFNEQNLKLKTIFNNYFIDGKPV